jgi:hypothetical protein
MTGIEKIIDDLAWRGPNGRLAGHVMLVREQAEELLAEIERLRTQLRAAQNKLAGQTDATPVDSDFLDVEISDIDFGKGTTARVRFMCSNYQTYVDSDGLGRGNYTPSPIVTVRDLVARSEAELLREPNIGRLTLDRMKQVLAAHGLKFRGKA